MMSHRNHVYINDTFSFVFYQLQLTKAYVAENVLIYLTLCYVHCSTISLFAISHIAMSLYSIRVTKTTVQRKHTHLVPFMVISHCHHSLSSHHQPFCKLLYLLSQHRSHREVVWTIHRMVDSADRHHSLDVMIKQPPTLYSQAQLGLKTRPPWRLGYCC